MKMENVGPVGHDLGLDSSPGAEHRGADERGQRAPIDREVVNRHPAVHQVTGHAAVRGPTDDLDDVLARAEPGRLLPQHALATAEQLDWRHVGDDDDLHVPAFQAVAPSRYSRSHSQWAIDMRSAITSRSSGKYVRRSTRNAPSTGSPWPCPAQAARCPASTGIRQLARTPGTTSLSSCSSVKKRVHRT